MRRTLSTGSNESLGVIDDHLLSRRRGSLPPLWWWRFGGLCWGFGPGVRRHAFQGGHLRVASASGSGSYEWRFHVLAVDRPTGSVLVSAGGASCGAPANVGYQASRFSWCTPLRGLANPISAVVVRVEARIFGSEHRSSSGVSPFGERPPLVAPFGWSWFGCSSRLRSSGARRLGWFAAPCGSRAARETGVPGCNR